MSIVSYLIVWIVLAFIAWIIAFSLVQRVVVPEHRIGLLFHNGRFRRRLDPGVYWFPRMANIWKLKLYDMRQAVLTVPAQELLSSDNVGLKVTLAISYEVVDPMLVENSTQNFNEAMYLAAQIALRNAVGCRTIEEVLEKRDKIGKETLEHVSREMDPLGVRVHYAEIKDVMFPGELKRIFNEVVKAKKEAQAMLEKARGETAVMRSLANVANMVKNNPELLKLKIVQAMAENSHGNTYVMGISKDIAPIDTLLT